MGIIPQAASAPRIQGRRGGKLVVGASVAASLCIFWRSSNGFSAPTTLPDQANVRSDVFFDTYGRSQHGVWNTNGWHGCRGSKLTRRALPELSELLSTAQAFISSVPEYVETLGPLGPLYFFAAFVTAEIFSLPGSPLMLSSGYIFGFQLGALVSIAALCTAATVSFFLARTILRPQLEGIAKQNETFQNIDCAVRAEGMKIIFLLRLAPLLPFALSNYAYGLSQVSFFDYIVGTIFGCAPGTCAFVYFAVAAKEVSSGEAAGSPWYVYAGGVLATFVLLKIVSDVATKAVQESSAQRECEVIPADLVEPQKQMIDS